MLGHLRLAMRSYIRYINQWAKATTGQLEASCRESWLGVVQRPKLGWAGKLPRPPNWGKLPRPPNWGWPRLSCCSWGCWMLSCCSCGCAGKLLKGWPWEKSSRPCHVKQSVRSVVAGKCK